MSILLGKESGKLTVKVAEDASPGVAWVRFFDDQSASALVPLVLSSVDVFPETEPNDKRSEAISITIPAVVVGRLAKNGDSDAYGVSIKAGQTLVVSATANQLLKSPMDAVLQLADRRGNVLAQSDDARGLDPQIIFTADADQDVLIRIFAFPETPNSTIGFAGSAAFIYSLAVTTGPFVDHIASDGKTIVPFGYNLDPQNHWAAVLSEPEKGKALSPPVATFRDAMGWSWLSPVENVVNQVLPGKPFDGRLPAVLFGHFTKPDESHSYAFSASKGIKYRAEVNSKSGGFLVDSKLAVIDQKSGKSLASNDDVSRGIYDAGVDFTMTNDGLVEVVVTETLGGFGPRHFYQLSIYPSEPQCSLSVSEEHFVVKKDKPLELTVTVTRTSGFDEKVQVAATGLPKGITCEPVLSEPKGDTSKSVKLKLIAGESTPGHGSFRIVGAEIDADGNPSADTTAARFELRPAVSITEFWLTIPPISTEEPKP
ncbi:PPC domain-containing protein [Rubripirellula reticaptiva]|uniref:PPC domain-containing protein n=1 Tax=Rubripirellula reticaptiva TaxID=2528013 RepID=UPI001FE87AB7|nr:PPC domain-containing protein [Rubripirellula reticaptiva]